MALFKALVLSVLTSTNFDTCHLSSSPLCSPGSSRSHFFVSAQFGGGRGGRHGGRRGPGQQEEKSEDYYKLLGVPKDANEQQIKKKFKKLAIKFHPDKNKDDPEAAKQKFQKIATAYETLMDADKRRAYDMGGEEAVRN